MLELYCDILLICGSGSGAASFFPTFMLLLLLPFLIMGTTVPECFAGGGMWILGSGDWTGAGVAAPPRGSLDTTSSFRFAFRPAVPFEAACGTFRSRGCGASASIAVRTEISSSRFLISSSGSSSSTRISSSTRLRPSRCSAERFSRIGIAIAAWGYVSR